MHKAQFIVFSFKRSYEQKDKHILKIYTNLMAYNLALDESD